MKRRIALVLLVGGLSLYIEACGSEWHMPGENITMPSSMDVGTPGLSSSENTSSAPAPSGVEDALPAGMRNVGTEVWFVPVPAGDMMRLAQEPDLWARAQKRVDVFALYWIEAYHHPGFECGDPCGPNTYENLVGAVPGGFFKWISDRFVLAVEGGSVKSHSCTADEVRGVARSMVRALDNVRAAGGTVSYISLDEPFASGTGTAERSPFGPSYGGCGLAPDAVAELQRVYNETVHAQYPEVQIGLIEPYPYFGVDELVSFLLELEHVGVPIPYFHLDLNLPAAVGERADVVDDVRRIREFCLARNIPFGIIVWGGDGTSNEGYSADAWAMARLLASSSGVTEHTIFQSWAEPVPGVMGGLKTKPDTVPETEPFTHTGLIIRILEFLQVPSAS